MSERKLPVFWSLEEEAQIATRAAELLAAEGLTSEPPAGKSRASKLWLDSVRRAQTELLPETRHKMLQSRHNFPDGFARKIALQLGILLHRRNTSTPAIVSYTEAAPAVAPQDAPVKPAGAFKLAEISDSDLVKELVTRLASYVAQFRGTLESIDRAVNRVSQLESSVSKVEQYQELVTDELGELREAIKNVQASALKPAAHEPKTREASRPVIVGVVGLLNEQFKVIQQRLKDSPPPVHVELEYYDHDKKPQQITRADFVVMARWISHKWWDLNKHRGNHSCIYADGGTTGIERAIRERLASS